jgi:hypothetical protein
MKKTLKLTVKRETLRRLAGAEMSDAAGGGRAICSLYGTACSSVRATEHGGMEFCDYETKYCSGPGGC